MARIEELEIELDATEKREEECLCDLKELQTGLDRLKEEKLNGSRNILDTPIRNTLIHNTPVNKLAEQSLYGSPSRIGQTCPISCVS